MTPEHLSYSQYNSYSRCPRSWYLDKIREAEPVQSWYIPIGSAVHEWIELHLQGEALSQSDRETIFYRFIRNQMEIEPDLSLWLAGGSKDAPITHEKALRRAEDCYERALEALSEVDVWEVEYDASGRLPGLSVPIKAYVDIIGEHKKKGPVIWDWKTGSTKPNNFQLETYAALLGKLGVVDVSARGLWGRYVMLAPGAPNTRHIDLSEVDPAEVGKKYQAVYDRMQAKHYETKAGFNCNFCFQQDNCLLKAGITPRSAYYDRSERDGWPF